MELLIPEFKIERRIAAIADIISEEHKASKNSLPPVMICVLNGGFMFFTDLVKNMSIDMQVDFIRPKSYNGKDNSGGVIFTKELEVDLKGKRVYIIEDIIDSGATMVEILHRVSDRMPVDVRVVTLVQRSGATMPADHFAFEIGDEFICGYGLDDNSIKRNYRNIYKV